MVKKKIDQRIRTLIENGVKQRFRSFFVIIGDGGKDQVVNLHYILSKAQVAKRPNILWCYKKDLGFSSHRKKRIKQMQKRKQLGIAAEGGAEGANSENAFELFLAATDIRYTYYHETDCILGRTFGMCVLQDFEAITPNLLARTIETVQGGGLVVLLLRSMTSLRQLYTMVMDVHARYRTENQMAEEDVVARFNERFLLSLATCESCLVLDDQLNVLPFSSTTREIIPIKEIPIEDPKIDFSVGEKNPVSNPALIRVAKTLEQAQVISSLGKVLAEHRNSLKSTVSLTASRGRGKSAALGLALAEAINLGYSNCFVTAPSPENLRTLFDFFLRGLDALGYQEHLDYDLIQSTKLSGDAGEKSIVRVNIFKNPQHRQTVLYLHPTDSHLLSQAELVLIDEAAAIPLPLVQSLSSGPQMVLMASTINGYEGTGRSLSLKLLQQLRKAASRRLTELQLSEPIRYAPGDPVEAWLNKLLCLDATVDGLSKGLAHPDKCDLYEVNRDTLFSFHRASEAFLQRIMALAVASHYKNTPNDLQLLSDAPAHRLFVLLPPVVDERGQKGLPDVLAIVQVCYEGAISRQTILNSLQRGKRSSGDLIPWTISQQFQDEDFASLSGARIVRVAVHPDLQSMGYGSRAIKLLERYFDGSLYEGDGEEEEEAEPVVKETTEEGEIKPRTNLKPLLAKLSDVKPVKLHWLGTSFGLTGQLYKFWKRLGYLPVYLRQTTNDITGEHTCIVLRALCSTARDIQCAEGWLDAFYADFRKRFVALLAFQFSKFPPSLCLDILETSSASSAKGGHAASMSAYDLKRLESYANNMVDYHLVMDLIPAIAREHFLTIPHPVHLSPVQSAILLSLGLQTRMIEDLEAVEGGLGLPVSQLLAMFIKAVRKYAQHYRSLALADGEPMAVIKDRHEQDDAKWDPTPQSLEADLEEGASEVMQKLRAKQREMINSLDLKQFAISATDEAWEREIGKKKRNLENVILNVDSTEPKQVVETSKQIHKEVSFTSKEHKKKHKSK